MQFTLWPEGAPGANGNGAEDCPTLTAYLATGTATRLTSAVIVCPGGGYARRAEHEGEPVARWLNQIGITAFVLQYRVSPYRHPYPLFDIQRAIRIVRRRASEWHIDPKKIGILGFSAGGHLCATAGTHFDAGNPAAVDPVDRESCRPDLMVLCYPVISFDAYRHEGSMVNLLGEHPDDALRRSLSNETQVSPATPPCFLWHTADDEGVPVENSLLFAKALRAHQVPVELHVYEHGPHGIGLAQDDACVGTWTQLCELWLERHGFCSLEQD